MLHILQHSPFQTDLEALLRCVKPGDDVLLLQDAVIAALSGTKALDLLLSAPISIYALHEDIEARGLTAQISNGIGKVSYTDFVGLTVKHEQQITW
ncbi:MULTISPECIES: sulfurtransferase complex subunit TusB [Buttiauxella]|uniref:Protein TusB n=1 Tax=Buttiauxella agrestis ATCC 33320 TaxID=1006004 RepID=A0A085G176_9ENTR|nr:MULTISPECIES: sulfurtransferase complex subunit TusB [Buttiauxella]KFC77471.1 intracellular sulfur oxidation protein [Buttiauxella agrestis ATCC 33320]MCS3603536.1 tRNA 2-thiouridine synthesizing protein B [Buttiauxella sp. BIGb0471]BCG07731.1 sulfurtransferase complex subunit TusB [Buttiauxella agrestis]